KFHRALRVLNDELAIDDGPQQRVRRTHLSNARGVTAVAAICRRVLRRVFLKRLAVGLRYEVIQCAIVSRFDVRISLQRLAISEVSDWIVALERDAALVRRDECLAAGAVAQDESGPILISLRDVRLQLFVEEVVSLFVVLKDQLAINDLKPLRAD